ncbi:hypothetical protein EK21DRAFT_95378 [Setomelanomma holmii]|uniref:Uncharacterized protein n=1 Tax=Setomelanomma holmii TaxID=210430 RepID=A0A9P4LG43_9PLEO|nr:hypothetical protein EK21DRAFT_95378 [Setomelanomma holmii]
MHDASGGSRSLSPIRSTLAPRQTLEAARLAQQQIQEEVEQIWGSSSIHALHRLFDPQELGPANVAQMWRCHQLRPEYKDFLHRWSQASRQEIAEVEFWYAYWYQEKRILERIADQRNILLAYAEINAFGRVGVEGRLPERRDCTSRMNQFNMSVHLVALWRRGRAWLLSRISEGWRSSGRYRRLEDHNSSIVHDEKGDLHVEQDPTPPQSQNASTDGFPAYHLQPSSHGARSNEQNLLRFRRPAPPGE